MEQLLYHLILNNLRKCGRGVGVVVRMPCAYFEGKNREMKAKKEGEGGIIISKKKKKFILL